MTKKTYSSMKIDDVLATLDKDTEYIGEDGLIHCKFCHDTKMFVNEKLNLAMRCPCECISKRNIQEREAEDRARHEREHQEWEQHRRQESLLVGTYREATFENTDIADTDSTFQEAYTRLQRYCVNAEQVLERGLGFFLYGKTGMGKTHLMSCVANRLLDNGYRVLFTNIRNIKSEIQETYMTNRSERDVEQKYIDIDFLFIDDIGAEKLVDANKNAYAIQTNLYNIVNGRLLARKPTCFTSNLSIGELVEINGLEQRTVDRINLMASMVKEIKGKNYRAKIVRQREEIF